MFFFDLVNPLVICKTFLPCGNSVSSHFWLICQLEKVCRIDYCLKHRLVCSKYLSIPSPDGWRTKAWPRAPFYWSFQVKFERNPFQVSFQMQVGCATLENFVLWFNLVQFGRAIDQFEWDNVRSTLKTFRELHPNSRSISVWTRVFSVGGSICCVVLLQFELLVSSLTQPKNEHNFWLWNPMNSNSVSLES